MSKPQVVHSQTIRRLEALGVGTWNFTSEGTLVRDYAPPKCTCPLPQIHTQTTSVAAYLLPLRQYDDGWEWKIHRAGSASRNPAVETGYPDNLANAALAVDARSRSCPGNHYEPEDPRLRIHLRGIFGPGKTRCGYPIEDSWDANRIVDAFMRATCQRCIKSAQQPHYTTGYETLIDGVKVIRLPVGKGWKIRCTQCAEHLDMDDPGGGYVIPFQAVEAAIKAHTLPGHSVH